MARSADIVVPNASEVILLDDLMGAEASDITCRLFTAPSTVDSATVIGSFTEASFSGYAAQALTFAAATTNAGGRAQSDATQVTFTLDADISPVDVIGFYVTDASGTELFFCAVFLEDDVATPITVENDGDNIKVTVNFTLREEPDPSP